MRDRNFIKVFLLFVAAPLTIWLAALSRTVRTWKEYRKAVIVAENLATMPESVPAGRFRSAGNVLSGGRIVDELASQHKEPGIEIIGYAPKRENSASDLSLYSAKLVLKGRYIPLVQTVNSLCATDGFKVTGLKFSLGTPKDAGEKITLEVFLLQIERDE